MVQLSTPASVDSGLQSLQPTADRSAAPSCILLGVIDFNFQGISYVQALRIQGQCAVESRLLAGG
ncbi:MAG: hypothetical protein IID07_06210 [Gemmatimonadetes bacterium]|nr:hypothetical protein [Gemmatimonadota bacterium]